MKSKNWLKEIPIAHRGLHDSISPENSLSAFKKALDKDFPIELDIHLLSDSQIVVFHDDNLHRMCGVEIKIHSLSSGDLEQYRLFNTKEKIPLLAQVLEIVDGNVPILIEIKSHKRNKRIHKPLMDLLDKYKGEYAIQSFNPFLLRWFVKNRPNVIRGQLSYDYNDKKYLFPLNLLLRKYLLNIISKPHFISHDFKDFNNKRIKQLKNSGLITLAWTLKNNNDFNNIKHLFDNIIFESFIPTKNEHFK